MDKIEVIIGTYEEFLVGYRTEFKDDKLILTQSFADRSHAGSVRCLTVSGKYVVSGGADDRIFVYDMKQRNQSQILQHHEGTVNAVQFTPDSSHLLSVGSDGHFVAVRLGSWMIEGNWRKAHGGSPVTHLTCHPSGKLALTLGNDLVLRTWNLVKGRVAYKTNLKGKKTLGHTPDCIVLSTEGNFFTIAGQRCVEIWSIQNADVIKTVNTPSRPVCVCWTDDNHVIVGLENGKILIVTIDVYEEGEDSEEVITVDGHSGRVKCLAFNGEVLISASSSGEVKVWTVDLEKKELDNVATTNIGCRPTCLGILDTSQFGSDYWKDEEESEDEEEQSTKKPEKKEKGVVVIEEEDGVDDEDLIEGDSLHTPSKKAKNKNKKRKQQVQQKDEEEDHSDGEDKIVKKKKFNKTNKRNNK